MTKILFLPQNYEAPKASNFYMKFQEGENKFRILSQPILGWEDWLDKKPVRNKLNEKPAKSIDPKKPIKHFWAMIVWNYNAEEIQILHLTQSTLRKSIEALSIDPDWGAPYFYDLKVIKTGEGIDTEYSLNPLPHKQLSPHIKEMFKERPCNLDALFYGDDPFSKEHGEYTQGIFDKDEIQMTIAPRISLEEAYQLDMLFQECDSKYQAWMKDHMKKTYQADAFTDLPAEVFSKLKESLFNNMEKNHKKQATEFQNPIDFIIEPTAMEG